MLFAEKMAGGADDDDTILKAFDAFEVNGKIDADMFKHSLMTFGDKFTSAEVDKVSLTVILSPFQSPVALQMSSPTFFGERPRGPILGARDEVAPTSPPTTRRKTSTIELGSNFGG